MCQHQQQWRHDIKQHATRQNLEHAVFERFELIPSLSESAPRLRISLPSKTIAQRPTIQQQRHMRSIKHDALIDTCIDNVRKHTMSPVDLTVAVGGLVRYHMYGIPWRRLLRPSPEHMRCLNKV